MAILFYLPTVYLTIKDSERKHNTRSLLTILRVQQLHTVIKHLFQQLCTCELLVLFTCCTLCCCIHSTKQVNISGEWSSWQNRVPKIEVETHKVGSPDVVVPTLDTVRHESLLNTWLAEHKPMVLCGPPGSGKTMTLLSALRSLPDFEVCSGGRWPMCV